MSLGPVMLDIDGTGLTPADRDLLREPAVGGVILFTRNYESVEQITDLVAEIRALRRPPLLIAVDHEGGRVQRFRDGFSRIPPMRAIGQLYRSDPQATEKLARQAGWLIGAELRAMLDDTHAYTRSVAALALAAPVAALMGGAPVITICCSVLWLATDTMPLF